MTDVAYWEDNLAKSLTLNVNVKVYGCILDSMLEWLCVQDVLQLTTEGGIEMRLLLLLLLRGILLFVTQLCGSRLFLMLFNSCWAGKSVVSLSSTVCQYISTRTVKKPHLRFSRTTEVTQNCTIIIMSAQVQLMHIQLLYQ